jgi:hypothetical protein
MNSQEEAYLEKVATQAFSDSLRTIQGSPLGRLPDNPNFREALDNPNSHPYVTKEKSAGAKTKAVKEYLGQIWRSVKGGKKISHAERVNKAKNKVKSTSETIEGLTANQAKIKEDLIRRRGKSDKLSTSLDELEAAARKAGVDIGKAKKQGTISKYWSEASNLKKAGTIGAGLAGVGAVGGAGYGGVHLATRVKDRKKAES